MASKKKCDLPSISGKMYFTVFGERGCLWAKRFDDLLFPKNKTVPPVGRNSMILIDEQNIKG